LLRYIASFVVEDKSEGKMETKVKMNKDEDGEMEMRRGRRNGRGKEGWK